jgi:hypothetical protein
LAIAGQPRISTSGISGCSKWIELRISASVLARADDMEAAVDLGDVNLAVAQTGEPQAILPILSDQYSSPVSASRQINVPPLSSA